MAPILQINKMRLRVNKQLTKVSWPLQVTGTTASFICIPAKPYISPKTYKALCREGHDAEGLITDQNLGNCPGHPHCLSIG